MRWALKLTALGMAVQVSDVDICNWAYEGLAERVATALSVSPHLLHQTDANQRTALHWACSSGQIEVVKALLSQGAKVQREPDLARYIGGREPRNFYAFCM